MMRADSRMDYFHVVHEVRLALGWRRGALPPS